MNTKRTAATTSSIAASVAECVFRVPGYYEIAVEAGWSRQARRICYRCDCIEFEIRSYLLGKTGTLHSVFREVRKFTAIEEHAPEFITACLELLENLLLSNEWYELMGRFDTVYYRLRQVFAIPDLPGRIR